jgi:CheY-like chemotaxis protein
LDAMDNEPLDVAELRSMLQDALVAAHRVREIVQSMRLLARGDTVQRARVNVANCLEQSIAFAANTLRCRARLVRDVAPDLYVEANAAQLSQVFVNLLANASHALVDEEAGRNEIRVTARREGERALIEIADNGHGISEELQSRIFEPFFTTKETGEGMGLGLSICRNIIEGLGGAIGVSSRVGQGTVFRVLLPVAAAAAPARLPADPKPPSSVPASGVRPRLLIVDDEQAVTMLLRHALAGEAYDVTAVASGREALTALQQQKFDLILCDLMMPEMTGEDVYLEATRVQPELASRFVFLTGGAFTPRGRQFIASVDAPVLEKPFEVGPLRALLRERLGERAAEAAQWAAAAIAKPA